MGDLAQAIEMLIEAKKLENKAKADRIAAEELIANLVDTPANGSATVDGGDGAKVTVKRAMGYKVDVDALRSLDCEVPLKMTDPVPAGYAFDQKAYEAMIKDDHMLASQLSEFIVATPRKVSVTVKLA
jgi:hypothetical protein